MQLKPQTQRLEITGANMQLRRTTYCMNLHIQTLQLDRVIYHLKERNLNIINDNSNCILKL